MTGDKVTRRVKWQKRRKIHMSVRVACQKCRKIHMATNPGRAAAQGSLCSREGLRPRVLFVCPSGGLGAGGGLSRGRRIRSSQKCGFPEGYPQKQLAFSALAPWGGAWGGPLLSLFVVCPCFLLFWDGIVESVFCRYLWYARSFC